ncbi:MAG: MFS transporter, partial [Blastococcus sp.]|nr:MFS transporter [Blastococcus sp.]
MTTRDDLLQPAPAPAAAGTAAANWAGVVSLGLGVFAIVMSEFLPANLLPRIAEDLGVSAGVAGQSVTVTALAAVPAALLVAVVLPRTDRRRVMIGLTALAVVSDVLGPLIRIPDHPIAMLCLGIRAGLPASVLARVFRTEQARAIFA